MEAQFKSYTDEGRKQQQKKSEYRDGLAEVVEILVDDHLVVERGTGLRGSKSSTQRDSQGICTNRK